MCVKATVLYDHANAMDTMGREDMCVYVAHGFPKSTALVKKKLKNVEVVGLEKTGFAVHELHMPALEDEDFAAKIEILFADITVLVKYGHRLINLKWFHSGRNGVDIFMKTLSKEELETPPKYIFTRNLGSSNAPKTTEYVIGQILARERNFYSARDSQRAKEWKQSGYVCVRDLSSLAIGILGAGDIGNHLAKACKSFGMTVWGLTRRPRVHGEGCSSVDNYRTEEGLVELLQNCDYICNLLPSTTRTRGLLSGDVLSCCSIKKSVFINVGRGDIIDEESLLKALRNGWLGGAILDVFEKEPLPQTSPLWEEPGVIITPHVSGWSRTEEFFEKVVDGFIDNYNRFINGEHLQGEVDWVHGY